MGTYSSRALLLAALLAAVCQGRRRVVEDSDDDDDVDDNMATRRVGKDAVHEYTIEHCVRAQCDPFAAGPAGGFTERGLIKYKKSRKHDDFVTIPTNQPLSAEDARAIQTLGQYMVRLVCRDGSACEAPAAPLFSSVSACRLAGARFKDSFVLHLDADGQLVSFEYNADGEEQCPADPPALAADEVKIRTSALITRPKEMPPLEQPHVDEGPVDEKTGEPLKRKQEAPGGIMGLFQRYWYIIVPMMLLQLVGPAAEDPKKGGAKK